MKMIYDVPNDILNSIYINYLLPNDMISFIITCKRLAFIINDEIFWKSRCLVDFCADIKIINRNMVLKQISTYHEFYNTEIRYLYKIGNTKHIDNRGYKNWNIDYICKRGYINYFVNLLLNDKTLNVLSAIHYLTTSQYFFENFIKNPIFDKKLK